MYGGMLAELGRQVAQEDFARKVAAEREGTIRGPLGEYSVGGYQSVIPNPGTESVPVGFDEPGLKAPLFDPVDFIAGGIAGKVGSSMARKAAKKAADEAMAAKRAWEDPFGEAVESYAEKAMANASVRRNKSSDLAKGLLDMSDRRGGVIAPENTEVLRGVVDKSWSNFFKEAADVDRVAGKGKEFSPNWNRTTRMTPEYGGSTAGAVIDGNPYLRTEPSKNLRTLSTGRGSWVNDAFPYSASERPYNPMRDELANRLYDSLVRDQISSETASSLMDMMYRDWR